MVWALKVCTMNGLVGKLVGTEKCVAAKIGESDYVIKLNSQNYPLVYRKKRELRFCGRS